MIIETQKIWQYLKAVKDPEIPALDVVEMGIVRDVVADHQGIKVVITPTYSGCPAMQVIEDEIVRELENRQLGKVRVATVFAPPWTTDWMGEEARQKMMDFGISPPGKSCENPFAAGPAICPYCQSHQTEVRSEFGSTACKSLHFCTQCIQPFEHFKCI